MERIGILLDKIKELNSKHDQSVIEIDLMMDYTRVLYADLIEWRNKISFNDTVAIRSEPARQSVGNGVADENTLNPPDVAAPSVELDTTMLNYESVSTGNAPSNISFSTTTYSNADIRQQIGINDKYQFISELFGNNKDAYEEVINELNTFDTEEEAMTWLNNSVSAQFGWKDDMEPVQSFYKLLSDFFANR